MTIKKKCSQGDSFLLHQVAAFHCHVKLPLIVSDVVVALSLVAKRHICRVSALVTAKY